MWTSVALAAALSLGPAQPAGGLQLTNVRLTTFELGPTRPDARFLPADFMFVGFDIEGLTVEADGMTRFTMAMEVQDRAGKTVYKEDPREIVQLVPLRGNKIPARAFVRIGLDQEAGNYACKVTVTDPKTKASNSLSAKFEVLKVAFGIVAVIPTHDPTGRIPAPTTGVVGQTIFVNFTVPGFQRDPKTKKPNVELEFAVLDEKGQPVLGQPLRDVQDEKSPVPVADTDAAFSRQFPLFLSRPGKFTLRITATDKVANRKATYDLPVTVLSGN